MDEEGGKILAGEEKSARNHFAARGGELVHLVSYRLLGSMTGTCTAATA